MARQTLTFLIVCPLVALMDDQVRRAGELGIKACALHLAQTMADPDILQRIREGQYEMVFESRVVCSERALLVSRDSSTRTNSNAASVESVLMKRISVMHGAPSGRHTRVWGYFDHSSQTFR